MTGWRINLAKRAAAKVCARKYTGYQIQADRAIKEEVQYEMLIAKGHSKGENRTVNSGKRKFIQKGK